jgi:hypothetical protein
MLIEPSLSCPKRSPENDYGVIRLSQGLSPSSYRVTTIPPAHCRDRDCLPEAVDAQLALANAPREIRHARSSARDPRHA